MNFSLTPDVYNNIYNVCSSILKTFSSITIRYFQRCKPSAIPIVLESLQVLSAIAFHHLRDLLQPHLTLLSDILSEMLQHEHQDVVLQSARVISIIGDGIQKLGTSFVILNQIFKIGYNNLIEIIFVSKVKKIKLCQDFIELANLISIYIKMNPYFPWSVYS